MRPLTNEWLNAANDDLLAMKLLMSNEHLTHIAAFHAQQCLEKTLKAILEENEIDISKTHKLHTLISLIPVKNISFDERLIALLDKLYIDARYPGDLGLLPDGKPQFEDVNEFFSLASYMYDEVRRMFLSKVVD